MSKRPKPTPLKIFGADIRNLSQLKQNDRFYFIRDQKKKVWQVVRPDVSYLKGQLINVVVCKDDLNNEDRFSRNRVVVFLRKKEGESWIRQLKKTPVMELDL